MNTYICKRDGNALEWRTHEFRPGGELRCWQCEQRLRNGLPLLPEKPETPLEELRKMSDDVHAPRQVYPDSPRYAVLTQGIAAARRMNAEWNRCQRLKAARRERGLKTGGWTDPEAQRAHLRRITMERSRRRAQQKAVEFGYGDAA